MTKIEKENRFNELVKEFRKTQNIAVCLFKIVMNETQRIEGFDSSDISVSNQAITKAEHFNELSIAQNKENKAFLEMKEFCKENRCMYLFKGWE